MANMRRSMQRAVTPGTAPAYVSLKKMYEQGAEQYDEQRYESAEGRFFNEWEGALLKSWIRPSPGTKILDMPAGTGRLCVSLAETGATIIGADIAASMLKVAAAKKTAAGSG